MNQYPSNNDLNASTYLALGDSYTIGEQVPAEESFPMQLVLLLRSRGYKIADPKIVAKTGWTTDELEAGINKADLLAHYNWVTLLIGVNNQYRSRSVDEYQNEFRALLQRALSFAGGRKDRVLVLSIPDWGVTPFAEGRDRRQIAIEIDAYNNAAASICAEESIQFIPITEGTRDAASDRSLLTGDGLHPSGKEYRRWAEKLADLISRPTF
jgi:lysophospholipase L1-like esterase